jgi:hypothetical protein
MTSLTCSCQVYREIIDSERAYLRHLVTLRDFFISPIKDICPSILLHWDDVKTIFSNIEDLILLSELILSDLIPRDTKSKATTSDLDRVVEVFLKFRPSLLSLYSHYSGDWESSSKTLHRLLKNTVCLSLSLSLTHNPLLPSFSFPSPSPFLLCVSRCILHHKLTSFSHHTPRVSRPSFAAEIHGVFERVSFVLWRYAVT